MEENKTNKTQVTNEEVMEKLTEVRNLVYDLIAGVGLLVNQSSDELHDKMVNNSQENDEQKKRYYRDKAGFLATSQCSDMLIDRLTLRTEEQKKEMQEHGGDVEQIETMVHDIFKEIFGR